MTDTRTGAYWTAMYRPCRCRHTYLAHDHFRPGTDCSLCPCSRFRWAWWRTA